MNMKSDVRPIVCVRLSLAGYYWHAITDRLPLTARMAPRTETGADRRLLGDNIGQQFGISVSCLLLSSNGV